MSRYSSTKILVGVALFGALSFVISYLEFPIFSAAPFLKLDFSSVFVLLSGFCFGPVWGVVTCVVKEFLCFLFKTSTGGVGEIANVIVTISFILLPTTLYRFKKGLPLVIVSLICACFITTGVSLLTNRFITFPLYMGEGAVAVFNSVWYYVLFFNFIKAVSISILTVLLYKRISWLLKKF